MCRKFLWCYVFLLILLDLSLNSKLTALGKSHDVTIQDSLREGMPFQEWDKEVWGESVGNMETEDEGEPIKGVSLDPPVLKFGQSALATPHARSVTITNTANTTIHLASVAGTTPDFHASFFESKTLAPQGNTTFTVVYLGRREGPVSARLYIHTSLGIQKYTVSAVGVASEYDVWPLVGVRVPLNATVEWELRLHNPTATTIQVTEVYSSGAWLSLALPSGGERGARALWSVPPRTTRALVRLRAAPAPAAQPLTAYVRVRGVPGGDLLLPVTARAAPPGEYARPLQVRQRPSGTGDPPYTVEIEMANSGAATITLEGGVRGACRSAPAPDPCQQQPRRANGASASGAQLTMLRTQLEPDQEFTPVARLTLDYGALWAQATGAGDAEGAWCAGCVRLGDALVPYSVRVLPGALALSPSQLLFVTSMGAEARRARTVTAHNEFRVPLHVHALTVPPELTEYFKIVDHTPLTIEAGASVTILELQLLGEPGPELAFDEQFVVHTDLSHYLIPLRLYSGNLTFEWEWGHRGGEMVQLGTLGTSTTRRVGVRVRNPAPLVMCVTRATVNIPGAAAALALPGPLPHCIEGGESAQAWLTVVAPAREGELQGEMALHTEHARSAVQIMLRVRNGRLRVAPLRLPPSAPYTRSTADLVVNNTMSVSMKVTDVTQPEVDPAVVYESLREDVEADGVHTVGRVSYEPERACHPDCYTGLNLDEPAGAEWVRRGLAYDEAALQADLALLKARLAVHAHVAALPPANVTLLLHTDEVMQTRVAGTVRARWPRLAAAGAGDAGRGALRTSLPLGVALYNPARVPLLLHARLAQPLSDLPDLARSDTSFCMSEKCTWFKDTFNLTGWRVLKGAARLWREGAGAEALEGVAEQPDELPPLLLAPLAEVELSLMFAPPAHQPLTAQLFLRNNLTVLEVVDLYGHGEYPTFDLAGRRPGAATPFLFEVKDCAWGESGVVERALTLRNTGRVAVHLTRWAVGSARGPSAAACAGRGFRVRPCAVITVPPAAAADLHVTFVPDYTLARVTAPLRAYTPLGPVEYSLRATIPMRVLAECAATAPRPPWENAMRALGVAVALAALALVLAAGALDAERLLRRARAARSPEQPSAPLDLRALRPPPPLPVQKPPTRRRRAARKPPAPDPAASAAERRAFERWRSEVLRREDDTSRSSEDDAPATPLEPPDPRPPTPEAPPPQNGDDAATSGSDVSNISNLSSTSTPVEEQEADECYGGDVEPSPRDLSPATPHGPLGPTSEPEVIQDVLRIDPPKAARVSRARRDTGDSTRRERRPESDRRVLVRPHARKERPRRRERVPSPPAPPVEEDTCEAPEEVTEAKGNVRWGASWSSVVAGAPLAPIGSDVRRREADRADQSLFYFNGERRADAVAWQPPPAPEPPRPPYIPGSRDYMEDCGGVAGGWWGGAGGGWSAWGAAPPLRPPPGFASPPPRPFDPFRSLASIWAPAPHDWRVADDPPRTPPARRSPADDPHARNGNEQTH